MSLPVKEKELVRDLAKQVAEIANEPRMAAIRKRWADTIALRKPDRAPVWCRPVGCWPELLPESEITCTDPWLRGLETGFRQTLVKREIDDDTEVTATFEVGGVFRWEPESFWGLDTRYIDPVEEGGSWGSDPPLKTESDFDRLTVPVFTYDGDATKQRLERAHDVFGGVLEVKLAVNPVLGATYGQSAAGLRGMEQMMMDMAAEPHLMHRLMSVLRDGTIGAIDAAENTGLMGKGPHPCLERGCYTDSQEFDQVSPAMWEEFCLDYQRAVLERYAWVSYGCCEDLTHKIDGVLSIPNLRIFVSSAWTDLDLVVQKAGNRYCITWRQKASDVVFPDDTSSIRKHLRDGAARLRGCWYQIVLRELQTLAGHYGRLHEWTRLAREAAEDYA